MSRDRYRTSFSGGERWDTERFAVERDRDRNRVSIDRLDERDSRFARGSGLVRTRERSVDDIYDRRRVGGIEEDRYERREYYDEEPRFAREVVRDRGPSITIEKERERIYDTSPPPLRKRPFRPGMIRRQSSLDTFDRRPLARLEREEYGPPARYREQVPLPPLTPIPLPRTRALPPPRRYADRDYYDEIKVADPDFYGDDDFRGYPERVREREIIRKRRSRSRGSRAAKSVRSSSAGSSSSSSSGTQTVRSEFPKRGKTRMPARLVSKKAIADLGYPYTEEGDTIIIQKALGRENIDEVIKLSEDYKSSERVEIRSTGGDTVYEERRQEVISTPVAQTTEVVTDTKIVRHASPSPIRSVHAHHHHHANPVIIEARPREESTLVERRVETIERSDAIPIGALALVPDNRNRVKDERSIRNEIRALEAEKEALRAERRAEKEMRRADRIRNAGRASDGDLVLYERDRYDGPAEEVTLVRRERVVEPDGGVRIEKDRKGRMSISVPKYR